MQEAFKDFTFHVGQRVRTKIEKMHFIIIARNISELEGKIFEKSYTIRSIKLQNDFVAECEIESAE